MNINQSNEIVLDQIKIVANQDRSYCQEEPVVDLNKNKILIPFDSECITYKHK